MRLNLPAPHILAKALFDNSVGVLHYNQVLNDDDFWSLQREARNVKYVPTPTRVCGL